MENENPNNLLQESLELRIKKLEEVVDKNATSLMALCLAVNILLKKGNITNAEVAKALTDAIKESAVGKPVQPSGTGAPDSDSGNGNSTVPNAKSQGDST